VTSRCYIIVIFSCVLATPDRHSAFIFIYVVVPFAKDISSFLLCLIAASQGELSLFIIELAIESCFLK